MVTSGAPEAFDTLEEAKKECVKDENCYKISNARCNDDPKAYYLCGYIKTEISFANSHGCTYEKPGKYIF